MTDWWAPPSGARVMPDGVPTRMDWPAGVDTERPGLESAGHERVVQRPDRQQWLTVTRPGEAELGEKPDEVDLGDAKLDVLALLRLVPMDEGGPVLFEPVVVLVHVPHADAVDPAAEVGGRRDVRADRDDTGGDFRRNA